MGSCHLPCEVERSWIGTQSRSVAERRDGRHVLLGQLEIEHVEVAHNPLGGHRLRDDYIAELDMPPNQYLCRCFSVRVGDRGHGRVVQQCSLAQWSPRPGSHAELSMDFAQLLLLQPGV